MPVPVTLPALGESVTEGTVTRWLKQVGDEVSADEALLEVSTDKVDTEIPSPAAGVLLEIKVGEDETVEVGSELAVIGDESESGDAPAADQGTDSAEASPAEEQSRVQEEQRYETAAREREAQPTREPEPEAEAEPDSEEEREPAPAAEAGGDSAAAAADGAKTSVTLPALGESVTEGTVTRWLKQVGDEVSADEALLEVSTDKVDTEIPAPAAGRLLEIKVGEDETVEVGAELAVIGSGATTDGAQPSTDQDADVDLDEQPSPDDEPSPDEPTPEDRSTEAEHPLGDGEPVGDEVPTPQERAEEEEDAAPSAQVPPPTPAPTPGGRSATPAPTRTAEQSGDNSAYVTPLVRKLAAQHDVDLSGLTGTGVGGRIRKQDVLEAAQGKQPPPREEQAERPAERPTAPAATSPLRGTTEKMSRLRKVIATRMVESLQTSAQLSTVVEVDVTPIARLRDRVKEQFEQREGVKLSVLPFFARATVDALKAYPKLNATIDTDKGEITYADSEHLGIAVDTERGLLVPVIKEAGDLSIPGFARKIADLAARTRDNKITPDELSGGTFTLTNTGSRGALFDTPIINQPQVGILGTGAVVKRAVVIDDEELGETIAVRRMAYLSLTYDHRLVDGADAARFLTAVKQRLEEADFEGELGL